MKTLTLTCLLLLTSFALADSIHITGTARGGFSQNDNFTISGASLSLWQVARDGPDIVTDCGSTGVCKFNYLMLGAGGSFGLPDVSGGTVNGKTAEYLTGALTFTGTFFVPKIEDGTITFPATMTGQIVGYQVILEPIGFMQGPKQFTVNLRGTGMITIEEREVTTSFGFFDGFDYTFRGTATPVPEPGTLGLMGSGLSLLFWVRRKISI